MGLGGGVHTSIVFSMFEVPIKLKCHVFVVRHGWAGEILCVLPWNCSSIAVAR